LSALSLIGFSFSFSRFITFLQFFIFEKYTSGPRVKAALATLSPSITTTVPSNQTKVSDSNQYVFIRKWGSLGSGDGQFNFPSGVAIDSSGNVYVADDFNQRIQKFDSNGNFITKWGSVGFGVGQFARPTDVAVDPSSDDVYVTEGFSHRVQKFDSNGNFITKWGSLGSGDGQFNFPFGVAVDSAGNVYVADTSNSRVQKFDSNGNFITKWGSLGSGDGQFDHPRDVAVDSAGNVYVAEGYNSRVQKFDSNGNFITKWGQFGNPFGITVDSSGNVYVADADDNSIRVFAPSSTTATAPSTSIASQAGNMTLPAGNATSFESDGNMRAIESSNNTTTNQNSSPGAYSALITTGRFSPLNITLAGSDPDNDKLTAVIVTNLDHGTLGHINQDTNTVIYTPDQDFIGVDRFTFKMNDGKTDSEPADVSITVNSQYSG
jgi:DNA-binding beta-propeller fold protein YncE